MIEPPKQHRNGHTNRRSDASRKNWGIGAGPKTVVIGGGTGISNILGGLKKYSVNLTAIVTMFDSGGSSGKLRDEFGYPPFGDLRQCLLALGEDSVETQALREALGFRFKGNSGLDGHNVGNLMLAALTTNLKNDLERAIEELKHMLRVTGDVVPVTLEPAELCAELKDGRIIRSETNIDRRSETVPGIRRIFLEPQVAATPRAIEVIQDADAIILGPGDLYTSILPNLLADGIAEAIASSHATKIYVCNLMTKRGETDGFTASRFLQELTRYLKGGRLDWAVINIAAPTPEIRKSYESEGAYQVEPDLDATASYVSGIITAPLATVNLPLRHDPDRTAAAILKVLGLGSSGANGHNVNGTGNALDHTAAPAPLKVLSL
jgi:uncharacterized cofD-like protein